MDQIPLSYLITALVILLLLSAFFSGSETALMAINRYRLRHLANEGHPGARRALRLLTKPDRLIGIILLGNNLVNIIAASLATVIAIRVAGQTGLLLAPLILTVLVLIFSEVTPKTWAAIHPESLAFPASRPLGWLLTLFYPIVAVINWIAGLILWPFGLKKMSRSDNLSREELRTLVNDQSDRVDGYTNMVLNILDLEHASVSDIMVPRNEIVAIDLADEWRDIVRQITKSFYTRLPVYENEIDNIVGILHVRTVVHRLATGVLDLQSLRQVVRKPYFIPETTNLPKQLLQFQDRERRIGLVVDEYGDIQGLLTLDDILEEIVGEYTTEPKPRTRSIRTTSHGNYLVDGGENVRNLNRRLGWTLPSDGARTLNGLLLEQLESIPEPGTEVEIEDFKMTITETLDNTIKTVEIHRSEVEE